MGYPNFLYVCVNHIVDSHCSRSLDGGLTFEPGERIHGVDGRSRDRGVATRDHETPACGGIFAALVPAGREDPGQGGGEEDTNNEQGERMREADAGHALAQRVRQVTWRTTGSSSQPRVTKQRAMSVWRIGASFYVPRPGVANVFPEPKA